MVGDGRGVYVMGNASLIFHPPTDIPRFGWNNNVHSLPRFNPAEFRKPAKMARHRIRILRAFLLARRG
jgi:hypothetical protein